MCGFTYNTIIHRYFYDILMYTSPTLSQPCPSAMLQSWSIRPPPCLVWGPSLALDQLGKACSVRIDDGQKKMMLRKMIFCVFTSYCMFFVYKNMTLITSMGTKMWKQVIFQQSGAHLTSARARTLGSAAPLPWWWLTCVAAVAGVGMPELQWRLSDPKRKCSYQTKWVGRT